MSKIEGASSRVRSQAFVAVLLGVTNAVLVDTAMASGATTVIAAFAGQPDVARNLTITGNAAGSAGNVLIEGANVHGELITETIALNGTNTVAGNKAFATVTKVTLPAYVASTDRVRVGTGAKLGLRFRLTRNSVIAAFLANVRETTAPTVAFSGTALESNTVTLNSALNGSAVIVDLYETL